MGGAHSDLTTALQKGDPSALRAAIVAYSIKADTVKDSSGNTVLCMAAARGNVAIADVLLDAGEAAVNGPPGSATTPLIEAAKSGHLPMIEFLCGHGARLNLTDSLGCTAMHHAAIHGHIDVMYDLAGRGAGISMPNNLKYTPLHKAAKYGQLDAVNALDVLGAQLYATTDAGETPLDIALACGRTLVVCFLKEAMERRPVRQYFDMMHPTPPFIRAYRVRGAFHNTVVCTCS